VTVITVLGAIQQNQAVRIDVEAGLRRACDFQRNLRKTVLSGE